MAATVATCSPPDICGARSRPSRSSLNSVSVVVSTSTSWVTIESVKSRPTACSSPNHGGTSPCVVPYKILSVSMQRCHGPGGIHNLAAVSFLENVDGQQLLESRKMAVLILPLDNLASLRSPMRQPVLGEAPCVGNASIYRRRRRK